METMSHKMKVLLFDFLSAKTISFGGCACGFFVDGSQ